MSLQQIIDSAVNVEVNRSKLVAQTVSRSGRISTASRNWANPFRFTVTPKPVWTAAEYRSVFGDLLDNDRYLPNGFYLNNLSPTTFLPNLGNSWMVPYQGGGDVTANNGNLDSYSASSETTGAKIVLTNINSTTITAGTYLVKTGDYIRPAGHYYPYIAVSDVVIPTAASGITGTVQPAGTTLLLKGDTATSVGNNVGFTSTTTRTFITDLSLVEIAGLSVGQILTKTSGSGAFGGLTYIDNINYSTTAPNISVTSTTAMTSGAITFSGTGPTSTATVCVPIHRGYLGTISTNTTVRVGARAALFNVMVSKLPQIRYLPGQLVELTGDIELIEQIQ
jgi:hypothetical protein